jgi:hypothetical protein
MPALCWGQSKTLSLQEVLKHLRAADAQSRAQSVSYTVKREYQLAADGATQPNSDVIAEVSYFPPAQKDYAILKAEGSDRGESIVRKILDHEIRMASHPELHEISPINYDFALAGREMVDGHDCYILQLTPKRQAVELVRGNAWVDSSNFSIRRIEGATAKSPSMWIKNLRVTVNYGPVNGIWVQTSTRAVADVRFVGPHVLTSRDLELHPASEDATNRKTRTPASHPRSSVGDAAAWVVR